MEVDWKSNPMNNKEWSIYVLAQPDAHTNEMVETACRLLKSIEEKDAAAYTIDKTRRRIYIASQIFETVHIAPELPSGYVGQLEQFHDEGPSVNNRRPPRRLATVDLRLLAKHYRYSAADVEFLAQADFGTWQKVAFNGGLEWEQQTREIWPAGLSARVGYR
jgi:hypothetical protein